MSSSEFSPQFETARSLEGGNPEKKESAATDLIRSIKTMGEVLKEYVNMARTIPEVTEVLQAEGDEGPYILTVISATPFDDGPRDSVFSAQLEVMQRMEAPLVGFHLVNIQELPGGLLEYQGLERPQVLWSR